MRFFYTLILTFLVSMSVSAQSEMRIAVFDPTSSGTAIDEGTKIAIREIISSTIVNVGGYNLVERSMLEKVMQEQSFSNSGVVDDGQATEIGKLAGANKVILSVVTLTGGRNMLSIKIIDVKTASVERQQVKVVTSGELLDVIESMTLQLVGASRTAGGAYTETSDRYVSTETNKNRNATIHQRSENYTSNVTSTDLVPGPDEIVFYLPSGYIPKKDKERDLPLIAKIDKEVVGSGTLSTGFCIRIPNPGPGEHTLRIGMQKIKFTPESFNFYELQIYRWNYLGKAIYGVSIKERKMIN